MSRTTLWSVRRSARAAAEVTLISPLPCASRRVVAGHHVRAREPAVGEQEDRRVRPTGSGFGRRELDRDLVGGVPPGEQVAGESDAGHVMPDHAGPPGVADVQIADLHVVGEHDGAALVRGWRRCW
jgi:hypothetical protein